MIEHSLRIQARPETVWGFFTDAERLARWWGAAELDARPGGGLTVRMHEGPRPVMSGRFVELVPYERLVFTFGWEPAPGVPAVPPGSSTVEITLTPDGDGTHLTLRHHGLPSGLMGETFAGWRDLLGRLAPGRIIDKIAWIYLDGGRILSTRSRGKDVYYLPGGKREPGEGDVDTLVREIEEELTVTIVRSTAEHLGTFWAAAHGHGGGATVQMTCYTAEHRGVPVASSEIEEVRWLTYADRGRVSAVDQVIFDYLRGGGVLG